MTIDQTASGCQDDFVRSSALTKIVSRVTALEQRFPSVSKSLLSIIDQAIFSGTSFLSAVIIGRMTNPAELGWYYLILSVLQIVATAQDSAIWSPYFVNCKRRQGTDLAEYSGSVWTYHLLFSLASLAGLFGFVIVLAATTESSMLPGLWSLLWAGPLILLRFAVRRFAFANLHVRSAIALDAAVAAAQLGGLVLIGSIRGLSLVNIYAVMGAASGLACLALYLLDPPTLQFARERFLPDWRNNWEFAKWAVRSNLTGTTTPMIILWILGLAVDATAAGVFGACLTLIGMTNVLLVGIDNVLTPQASHAFASGTVSDLRRILMRTAAFLVLALGGLCAFVFVTGDWLATSVFGSDYQGTGAILILLSLSAVMNSLSMVSGGGLWVINRPRANFQADVSGLGTTLITAMFLINTWGGLGAATSMFVGSAVAAVVRCLTLAHHLDGVQSPSSVSTSADYSTNINGSTAAS